MKEALSDIDVAIVTVTYNSSVEIEGFLSSALAATERKLRVVVVDNASDDAEITRSIAERYAAQFISLTTNGGYGRGINAGIDAITGIEDVRHVLISNPDVILSPGSLDELLEALTADPTVGAVGPRILTESGETYPSARALPSLSSGIGHALFARIWPKNPWTRHYHNSEAVTPHSRDVGWLSGACMAIRVDAFQHAGGFDEGFFMYFEDVDLGRKLREAGWKNRYLPSVDVVHMGARSTSQKKTAMIEAHHKSAYRYLAARYPHHYQAPLRWALKSGLRLRMQISRPK